MTIFYDLFLFVKNSIYTDLLNAFNLFPFLKIELINSITLSDLLATITSLSIVAVLIMVFVSFISIPIKLIKGALKWKNY